MVMLLVATRYELPVSTTHTIVGCMIGSSIGTKGFDSIEWPIVNKIFISWIASPGASGVLVFLFFSAIRVAVLKQENCFQRAYYTFPLVLFGGIWNQYFLRSYKGTQNRLDLEDKVGLTIGISFGIGALCGLIWVCIVGHIAKQRVDAHLAAA